MKIETIEDAKSLVGKTFERDGKRRIITRIENLCAFEFGGYINLRGDVYWKRPGGNEQKKNIWLPYFCDWLSGATEVQEPAQ